MIYFKSAEKRHFYYKGAKGSHSGTAKKVKTEELYSYISAMLLRSGNSKRKSCKNVLVGLGAFKKGERKYIPLVPSASFA